MNIKTDFVNVHSDWEQKFGANLSGRSASMKAFLNLVSAGLPGVPVSILETGCMRLFDDWGGGCSSWVISDFMQNYVPGGTLVSVDIVAQNLACADYAVKNLVFRNGSENFDWKPICGDSLAILGNMLTLPSGNDTRFTGIYLDSMDCDPRVPEGKETTEESQKHQLCEAKIALQLFDDKAPFKVLLLDDNDLPYGGKCKLTKEYLLSEFWACVMDGQQSLWIKRNDRFKIW